MAPKKAAKVPKDAAKAGTPGGKTESLSNAAEEPAAKKPKKEKAAGPGHGVPAVFPHSVPVYTTAAAACCRHTPKMLKYNFNTRSAQVELKNKLVMVCQTV